ncbi:MAG: ribosome-associated translation inhibitor RaiA [Verrucomicrobia bacterium]|nr:ribosome-associated translation inhibitor RaiA [Verrucomicrobiota bacterium]
MSQTHSHTHAEPEISVTGRHVSVTEAIKEYARKKISHIGIDFPRILNAQVILDVEKYRHMAEVILHCNNHITIEAREVSEDMYASIDAVVDKLTRQLRKAKTKIQRHQPRRGEARLVPMQVIETAGTEDETAEITHHVVRTEQFTVKPMFVDEAVLQLELSPKVFLVFQNAENQRLNVLYRRKNGDFGLIDPHMA